PFGNTVAAGEPTTGCYFRYSNNNSTFPSSPNWVAVCANNYTSGNNQRTPVDTNVPASTGGFHRFEIKSDGGGNVYFYIDGAQVAVISTNRPTSSYAPMMSVQKVSGTGAKSVSVDYFALRWETYRP